MSDISNASEECLRRLAAEGRFHPGEIAELMQMTERQFRNLINALFGCSPQEWLDKERRNLAESKFRAGLSTKHIAADTGFESIPSFCRWWRRQRESNGLGPKQGI